LKLLQVQQELQRETADLTAAEKDLEELSNADRAISVVKRKLASLLSPEADVRRLVLEATDMGNLSRMFHGMTSCVDNSNLRLGCVLLRRSPGRK
jgi:hypothetical protein